MTPPAPIITTDWLSRPAHVIAPALIGCTLVRQLETGQQVRGMIVETEAYGPDDPACHGYRGRTPRTQIMFGPAGFSYVYLIYGMYHCFNVVTDQTDVASAVLVRALEMVDPLPEWVPAKKRQHPHRAAAGPGKLCQVMNIDRQLSDRPLLPSESLWLEARSPSLQIHFDQGDRVLVQTTRIGLSQAQDVPWRWYLQGSPAISKP
ncbi:MAG: DNA-3-methyladenine glycosylase [Cyanothece sp. SIO2G6]|nr:DNA-3-methyladenine glycosylase [Cyanothece sp. SIO2G6]